MPFDQTKADTAVQFFETYLKHTKGMYAGTPFLLRDWQSTIIRNIFGTVNTDGYRQYRTCYIEIPRKNGKSEMAAGVALKLLLADKEPGAEIYSCAADKSQAAIVFKVAASMIRRSKMLSKRCKILDSSKTIVVPRTESIYRVLSADGPRQHGLNPHGVIFDEVHTQRTRDLWEAMTTGSDTRSQSLVFAITTAGIEGESPLWSELSTYSHNLERKMFVNPSWYAVLYSTADHADWTDEKVWKACNPALGDFLSMDKMREACLTAQQNPLNENTFKRYRLNMKTQQVTVYIPVNKWDDCTTDIDLSYARHTQEEHEQVSII